jgi:hypothetical protein
MDYFGPAISAVLFVLIMSFVPEPARLRFNAIFAAGAVGVYLNGGFGITGPLLDEKHESDL